VFVSISSSLCFIDHFSSNHLIIFVGAYKDLCPNGGGHKPGMNGDGMEGKYYYYFINQQA